MPPTGSHSSVVVCVTPWSKPVCATSIVSEVAGSAEDVGVAACRARGGARVRGLLRAAAGEGQREQQGDEGRLHEPCSRAAATISSMSGTSPGA